jgi:hypothetical protein
LMGAGISVGAFMLELLAASLRDYSGWGYWPQALTDLRSMR